jgi:hypothetical protein
MGGCRELVKTIISALPTYLLIASKPLKGFYKEMNKIRRRFLWAGQQELHGGKCKVNWAGVCQPLHRGGIGIPDLQCFGRALRLRWLWFKWKTPNKPWCGMELPVDEALFATATKVTVHNGTKAQFWTSSWLQGCAPTMIFPDLFKHNKRKNRSVADAMNHDN